MISASVALVLQSEQLRQRSELQIETSRAHMAVARKLIARVSEIEAAMKLQQDRSAEFRGKGRQLTRTARKPAR